MEGLKLLLMSSAMHGVICYYACIKHKAIDDKFDHSDSGTEKKCNFNSLKNNFWICLLVIIELHLFTAESKSNSSRLGPYILIRSMASNVTDLILIKVMQE